MHTKLPQTNAVKITGVWAFGACKYDTSIILE